MAATIQKRANPFSQQRKNALLPGQELTDGGLVWRKRKDGTGTFRYDFVDSGERHKGVIGAEKDGVTLSQARVVLAEIKAKAISDRLSGKTGRSTQGQRRFDAVAEEFLQWSQTHHRDRRHNRGRMEKHLLPRFGSMKLADVNAAMVEKMRSELYQAGLAKTTVQRIVSLLSGVYMFARKSEPDLGNPTERLSRVKVQSAEIVPFTRDETDLILTKGIEMMNTVTRGPDKGKKTKNEARTREAKVLVGLALFAGLRASEVLGLAWEHVDLEENTIRVTQTAHDGQLYAMTKSYKARTVPITGSLRPLLVDLYQHHERTGRTKGLLLSRDGQKPYFQVQRMFDRIKKQAGVEVESGFHALRHTFATRAVESGVTLPSLQRWLGHSDIKVTMRYIHTSDDHMKRMASMLD